MKRQGGWALLTIVFFCALLVISLTSIAPRAAFETRREREDQLISRGKDYARAVQLYFRKFRRYPARLEELENTNQLRFLRRRWTDPMTGSDEWRLLHMGPAGVIVDSVMNAPGTVPGLPGAPGSGAGSPTVFGVSATGQPVQPGQPPQPGAAPPGQATSGFGQSGFGQPTSGFGQPTSGFGQPGFGQPTSGFGQSGFGRTQGAQAAPPQQSGFGQSGFGQNQTGGVLTSTLALPTTVPGTLSGFVPGTTGPVMGTGIAGVASKSEKASIKVYNGRQKYNEWEFVYDVRKDPMVVGQPGFGQPPQQPPRPPLRPPQP